MTASDPPYQLGEHADLLSALLHNARASLGEIAEQTGSYRQKVWRTVQALQDDIIWGYTAIIDDKKLGWRRYVVLLKLSHVSRHFIKNWRSVQDQLEGNPTLRLVNAHVITGIDYNFMLEVACQNRIELQVFLDVLQNNLEAIMERPPNMIEAVHTMRQQGFQNPDEKTLGSLVEEMGIVHSSHIPS